jgi:DNA-binding transcriptional LysR family regulator
MISLPSETYTRRLVDGAAATAGLGWNHAVVVPGFLEMLSQVRAGIGIGVLPESALPQRSKQEVATRVLADPALAVWVVLITLRGRELSPTASSFMSLVVAHLKETPPHRPNRAGRARGNRPTNRASKP